MRPLDPDDGGGNMLFGDSVVPTEDTGSREERGDLVDQDMSAEPAAGPGLRPIANAVPSGPADENSEAPSTRHHPAAAFLGKEFLLWLWWRSESGYGNLELPHYGSVDLWIDDRIQFRTGGDDPQTSDLKGGAPATSAEAKMALVSGKTVETASVGMRVKDREFYFSLRSDPVELAGLKVPGEVNDGVDERIFERMFLLEEATGIVDTLFFLFCEERLSADWNPKTLPSIRSWIAGDPR